MPTRRRLITIIPHTVFRALFKHGTFNFNHERQLLDQCVPNFPLSGNTVTTYNNPIPYFKGHGEGLVKNYCDLLHKIR